MIARNLLGRLNARSPDDLQRIAAFWLVPLPGADRGRHVGMLYRAMTDLRYARSVWERLDHQAQVVVRDLATSEAAPSTIEQVADLTGLPVPVVREAAIRLLQTGLLSREGEHQELPVGASPRVFLPREVGQVFRRVQDEIDAGDLSGSPLRVMLETLDEPELEDAAITWGIRVIPGQRRRADLVSQIMRQIGMPERVAQVVAGRGKSAAAIWRAVQAAAPAPVPLRDALAEAGLGLPQVASSDHIRRASQVEDALGELEGALLVFHTYQRDGSRWLFVPREIASPGEVAATLPMHALQPLPPELAPVVEPPQPYSLAWDVLTLLREIAEHGSPVWVPGEPMARPWQRRLNRRLWAGGEDIPPRGYMGFLLYLASTVGVIRPSDQPLPTGSDKAAVRPSISPYVREWTRLGFEAQQERLRDAWLECDVWIEGREREEIDVWGADWRGFRQQLLDALGDLDPTEWLGVGDLAARLAEQHPTMIGTTFTAASSRPTRGLQDERAAAIAQVIEVELETAASWFGLVQLVIVPKRGEVVSPVEPVVAKDAGEGPAIEISATGAITLLRPTPLHVWSLSAFADAESLRPQVTYQLRPGSVGRALGAGFDLGQITSYLETQLGAPLPETVLSNLRDWTVGYKRVRLQRVVVLNPDSDASIPELREVLRKAGFQTLDQLTPEGDLMVVLGSGKDPSGNPEDELLGALRASGYMGQWGSLR